VEYPKRVIIKIVSLTPGSDHADVGVMGDFLIAPAQVHPPENDKYLLLAQGTTLLPDPGFFQLLADVKENRGVTARWKGFI